MKTQSPNKLNKQTIRERLEAEREELLSSLEKKNSRARDRNPDRDDLARAYSTRERRLALQAMETEQLEQIDEALKRLEDDTYGRCQSCGEQIPAGRLEVLPHALFCVPCQSEHERMYGTL